jgi:hypothetical protein
VQIDLKTALELHLGEPRQVNGLTYKSSLVALLADARGAAQRDQTTGDVLPGSESMSWLGAVGYLILLDQIGKCFKPVTNPATDAEPIIRALRNFSSVQDHLTLQALYALRNALAHDYALFNANANDPARRRAFNFCVGIAGPVVQLPTTPWGGSYDATTPVPDDQITVVNIRKVGDVAEEVVTVLRRLNAQGALDIGLPLDQFHVRYGLRY